MKVYIVDIQGEIFCETLWGLLMILINFLQETTEQIASDCGLKEGKGWGHFGQHVS